MKYMIILSLVYGFSFLSDPCKTLAFQVSKNSVILDKVSELKNSKGEVFAEEAIYLGGITQDRSSLQDSNDSKSIIRLREIQKKGSAFTLNKGETRIKVKVIPVVEIRNEMGLWQPAEGRWDFHNGETSNYISAIHVRMGGDLDFAYQSTAMKVEEKENVLHYGLTGNPHAISLSKKRLKALFPAEKLSEKSKPTLHYQPSPDIILVQIELTSEGLSLVPIFDYQVVTN